MTSNIHATRKMRIRIQRKKEKNEIKTMFGGANVSGGESFNKFSSSLGIENGCWGGETGICERREAATLKMNSETAGQRANMLMRL